MNSKRTTRVSRETNHSQSQEAKSATAIENTAQVRFVSCTSNTYEQASCCPPQGSTARPGVSRVRETPAVHGSRVPPAKRGAPLGQARQEPEVLRLRNGASLSRASRSRLAHEQGVAWRDSRGVVGEVPSEVRGARINVPRSGVVTGCSGLREPDIGSVRPARDSLPGLLMDLHVAPLNRPLGLDYSNKLHGLVTVLTGVPHLEHIARFVLLANPSSSSGWSVYVPEDSVALRMAKARQVVSLGRRTVIAEMGPARRVPAPSFAWEWSTVCIQTVTPLLLRKTSRDASGCRKKEFRLDFGNLFSTLLTMSPQRCGASVWAVESRFGMRVLTEECRHERIRVGGPLGRVTGLSGRIVARVCPGTRWLLEACQTVGFGGRVAYGFGNIVVEEV